MKGTHFFLCVVLSTAARFSLVAATFTVINTFDTGIGSMRQAITDANANTGLDTVAFAIPGSGVHTISPASALPIITDPVIIDGYTQSGASINTLANGDNAVLKIELEGSLIAVGTGLSVSTSNCTVRGMVINRFQASAIFLESGTGHVIEGNFIGTDPTGTTARPNGGIAVFVLQGGTNTIGGTSPAATAPGVPPGNLISGNTHSGFLSGFNAQNTVIQGNIIGADITGSISVSNGVDGGSLEFMAGSVAIVGGTSSGEGNLIAFNGGSGVAIGETSGGSVTINVPIRGNSIFANGGLGIAFALASLGPVLTTNDLSDADNGPNRLQNFSVLTNVSVALSGVTIQGCILNAPNTAYRLDFFANTACDPTGFGEGETFIGATNINTGATCSNNFSVTFSASVPCRFFATATATDPDGNTSEFSACRESVGVDIDGDGACDVEEVLAGTDLNNPASVFRITAITRENDDIRVTWQTAGGRTNQL